MLKCAHITFTRGNLITRNADINLQPMVRSYTALRINFTILIAEAIWSVRKIHERSKNKPRIQSIFIKEQQLSLHYSPHHSRQNHESYSTKYYVTDRRNLKVFILSTVLINSWIPLQLKTDGKITGHALNFGLFTKKINVCFELGPRANVG